MFNNYICLTWHIVENLFVSRQQNSGHLRTIPEMNQYKAEDKGSCSRIQRSASGDA